jgi:hypothetical protein
MSMALEEVCRVLRIGAGAGRDREVVAIRIIELARRGEVEYRRLVERVLKEAGADWARPPSLGMASEVTALVPRDGASLPGLALLRPFVANSSRRARSCHADASRTSTALVSGCAARSATRKHLAARSRYVGLLTLLIPLIHERRGEGFIP